jgi:flagellar export protein FliJ
MKDRLKASLKRLERLLQIRETYVSIAEAAVKSAEGEVRRIETTAAEVAGNIQHTRAEIAYLKSAMGKEVQNTEKYLKELGHQQEVIRRTLETATTNLDKRRSEWTEAMKEQKVIEKLQERRLHQWEREDDVANRKAQDDVSIGRYVRTRIGH